MKNSIDTNIILDIFWDLESISATAEWGVSYEAHINRAYEIWI